MIVDATKMVDHTKQQYTLNMYMWNEDVKIKEGRQI